MGAVETAIHSERAALQRILGPLTLGAFFAEIWEKSPTLIRHAGAHAFDDIITVAQLDAFLSRSDIRNPTLRMVRDGAELPLEEYTRELKLGAHVSRDLIDNEKLFTLFQGGGTIVLQFLQNNIASFGHFSNALENDLGCNVHGSCFITPPEAQGFTAHYDTYSFFVIQIRGTKRWKLYNRTALAPIREDRDSDFPWIACDPIQEYTLEAGDVLYVPRGYFHEAATTSDPSIHLTLGLFVPTWIDVIRAALNDLYAVPEMRENPSFCRTDGGYDVAEAELSAIRRVIGTRLDLRVGLERISEQQRARRVDTRQNRLSDSLAAPGIDALTALCIQPLLSNLLSVTTTNDAIVLDFVDKRLRYPAYVEPSIRQMLSRDRFTPLDVAGELDVDSCVTLCRQLLHEGFLTAQ